MKRHGSDSSKSFRLVFVPRQNLSRNGRFSGRLPSLCQIAHLPWLKTSICASRLMQAIRSIREPQRKLGFPLPQQPECDHSAWVSGMSHHIRVDGQNFALKSEVARLLSSEPTRMPSHVDLNDEPGIPIHACLARIADHVSQQRGCLRVCDRWQPIACRRDGDHSPLGSEDEPTLRLSSPGSVISPVSRDSIRSDSRRQEPTSRPSMLGPYPTEYRMVHQ
jgi:hypothetical protein